MSDERILMYKVSHCARDPTSSVPIRSASFRPSPSAINNYTHEYHGPYDMQTLMLNVSCVCAAIRAGRFAEPEGAAGWVDAVVAEFIENEEAFRTGPRV